MVEGRLMMMIVTMVRSDVTNCDDGVGKYSYTPFTVTPGVCHCSVCH